MCGVEGVTPHAMSTMCKLESCRDILDVFLFHLMIGVYHLHISHMTKVFAMQRGSMHFGKLEKLLHPSPILISDA